MSKLKDLYTIRQAVELTGASEFLLRVWENRYKAFKPQRTKTRRRLYSKNDLMKARLLLERTKQGYKIGQMAQLPIEKLKRLPTSAPSSSAKETETSRHIDKLFHAVRAFDWDEVRSQFKRTKGNPRQWIRQFIIPTANHMNRLVDTHQLSISQEHILSAMLKETLGAIPNPKPRSRKRPRMVFATPEGDYHELGLLIAAKIAGLAGTETLVLGSNMPKRDLAETCVKFNATHLVLASSITRAEGAKEDLFHYVHFLDRTLNRRIHFWLAGRSASLQPIHLKRKYQIFPSFEPFEREVIDA